ncbi:MAG: hypothetical protein ABIA21_00495 [Candidatus Aenigmatarchaeota archaeon]
MLEVREYRVPVEKGGRAEIVTLGVHAVGRDGIMLTEDTRCVEIGSSQITPFSTAKKYALETYGVDISLTPEQYGKRLKRGRLKNRRLTFLIY